MKEMNSRKIASSLSRFVLDNRIAMLVFYGIFCLSIVIGFYVLLGQKTLESDSIMGGFESRLNDLNLSESSLMRDSIKLQGGVYSGIDPILTNKQELVDERSKLLKDIETSSVINSETKTIVSHYLSKSQNFTDNLQQYLDSFKSYKDSERGIPVAKKNLLQEIRQSKSANDQSARSLVDQLYNETQIFLQSPDLARKDFLFSSLNLHKQKITQVVPDLAGLSSFVTQNQVLVSSKINSLLLLDELISNNNLVSYERAANALSQLGKQSWLSNFRKSLANLLFAFSVFGLATVIGFFFASSKPADLNESTLDGDSTQDDDVRTRVSKVVKKPSKRAVVSENNLTKDNTDNDNKELKYTDLISEEDTDEIKSGLIDLTNNKEIERVSTEFYHQIKTPLAHIEESVLQLRPILDDVHQAFDYLENDLAPLPDPVRDIVRSKKIVEFPFVLDDITVGVKTANDIANNIRQLSSETEVKRVNLDFNTTVRKAIDLKKSRLKKYSNLKLQLDDQPGVIRAVSADIVSAIAFVIDNAIDAVSYDSSSAAHINISTVVRDKQVKLIIEDNGGGISSQNIDKIYEPFFSQFENAKKSGMGLTIAKQNIERHGGHISIVSGMKKGVVVRIVFPVLERSDFSQYIINSTSEIDNTESVRESNNETDAVNSETLDPEIRGKTFSGSASKSSVKLLDNVSRRLYEKNLDASNSDLSNLGEAASSKVSPRSLVEKKLVSSDNIAVPGPAAIEVLSLVSTTVNKEQKTDKQ